MHAISSYHGNRPIHTHRQDRLQYTAPQLACSVTRSKELIEMQDLITHVMIYDMKFYMNIFKKV